jgi:hypothetical protein
MKIYTVHLKKGSDSPLETAKFVREGGFSVLAGVFQLFWALFNKMWFCAALLFLAQACLVGIEKSGWLTHEANLVLRAGFFVFVALSANDWFRANLQHKGYVLTDVVFAKSELEAQAKFITVYTLVNPLYNNTSSPEFSIENSRANS